MSWHDGSVELREIETFLVLAEELHFGRTAERLYVSPSRVSQTVRAMEQSVGARLFERTSRQVRLTALGEQLRERLRPAFDEIEQAVRDARVAAGGITGRLRISLLDFTVAGPAFEEIVRLFEDEHRGCQVIVYEAFPGEALGRLRRGELDIVVHWLPLDDPALTVGPHLHRADGALAVQLAHPLAARGWAVLEDLADHAVVDTTATLPAATARVLSPERTPGGRPIPRRHQDGRMAEVLSLVARGEVVHPTVSSLTAHYAHPGVTTVPLRDMPPLESALVWATERESSAIRAFAAVAETVVAQR